MPGQTSSTATTRVPGSIPRTPTPAPRCRSRTHWRCRNRRPPIPPVIRAVLGLFSPHVRKQYQLEKKVRNRFIYLEIRRSIYGLPQAGAIANAYLTKKLKPHGYYEVPHTPGLWKHISSPVQFSLVVDDFGVKCVGKEHALYLVKALKEEKFTISEEWEGNLYCGISLKWDYNKRELFISMPGYIKKQLQKYKHLPSPKPQHSPFPIPPPEDMERRRIGKSQRTTPPPRPPTKSNTSSASWVSSSTTPVLLTPLFW